MTACTQHRSIAAAHRMVAMFENDITTKKGPASARVHANVCVCARAHACVHCAIEASVPGAHKSRQQKPPPLIQKTYERRTLLRKTNGRMFRG